MRHYPDTKITETTSYVIQKTSVFDFDSWSDLAIYTEKNGLDFDQIALRVVQILRESDPSRCYRIKVCTTRETIYSPGHEPVIQTQVGKEK